MNLYTRAKCGTGKKKTGEPLRISVFTLRIAHGPSAMVFDKMPGRAGVIAGASGGHAASIGCECPDSDRLNKYRESYGDALKLEARLHLFLHIHCESVEWRELRGSTT